MPSETRYCQNASHTINTITANKLLTSNTSSGSYFGTSGSAGITLMSFSLYSVERVQADGTITTIAKGSVTGNGLADTTRTEEGQGIQSDTWNCPETALDTTDAIRIRLRARRVTPTSSSAYEYFITDQLGAYQLDAETWTQYLYSWWYNASGSDFARIGYGSSTYSTRITGFSYSVPYVPVAATLSATSVLSASARLNGKITDDGHLPVEARFRYSILGADDWTTTDWQNTLSTDDTFYEDISSLAVNTEYEFQVQARNTAGEGAWTASAYFETAYPPVEESFDPAVLELCPLSFTDGVKWAQGFSPAVLVTRGQRFANEILDTVTVLTDTAIVENNQATLRGIFSGLGATKRGFYLWDETWDYPPEES